MTTTEEHPEYMAGCVPPSAGRIVYNPPAPAIHTEELVSLARKMGVTVEDEDGQYIGLTHKALAGILMEWDTNRRELGELKFAVGKLRWWMSQNTRVEGVADQTDAQTIETARALMETVKTVVASTLPVVRTIWGNIAHTFRQAGLIDHLDDRPTGDITPEDRVVRRPR